MKAAAIGLLAVAFFAMPVNAATLVCEGQLRIPCGPNPYELPRHGACGKRTLSNIVVELNIKDEAPCSGDCGTVRIDGSELIDGQYGIWGVTSSGVLFNAPTSKGYGLSGLINRITGSIQVVEHKFDERGYMSSDFLFDGWSLTADCERRERLF